MKKRHEHKKTYYNDIALRLAQKLFGIEHLHYGWFDANLAHTIDNYPKAQENYAQNIISHIPQGVNRIFDVGCGTGGMAKILIEQGKTVACLAPDPFLIEKTKMATNNKAQTVVDLYENIKSDEFEKFDLVLMSESCQYINIAEGWAQNKAFLKPKGYVLIADFFKIKPIDRDDLSKSGHDKKQFLTVANEFGFSLIKEVDITEFVSPTMDIYQKMITEKVVPVAEAIFEIVKRKVPFVYKTLKKIFGKKIEKLHRKYQNQDSKTFKEYKGYFIFLFQKND